MDITAKVDAELEEKEAPLGIVRRYCAYANEKSVSLSPLYITADSGDAEAVRALLTCTQDMVHNESEEVRKHFTESLQQRIDKPSDAVVREIAS